MTNLIALLLIFALVLSTSIRPHPAGTQTQGSATLRLSVFARITGKPAPCNVFLKGPDGKPVQPAGFPFWHDHFSIPGTAKIDLSPGEYSIEVERGPEWKMASAHFTADPGKPVTVDIQIDRIADMAARGWRSGEMHIHRPLKDIPLLMEASDLQVAPVITWWNAQNTWSDKKLPVSTLVRMDDGRSYDIMGGEDEREGGALLYFGLNKPMPIQGAERDYPSSVVYLEVAKKARALVRSTAHPARIWADVEKPFWWDTPIWLATGLVDSIGLANNHMCRSQMYENEAWGKPRDAARLPSPLGNGYWTQEIYYRILECGFRIPHSAGSASGVLPNPVGYNRIYAHTGSDATYDGWWDAVRAGRSFVTNGPLLDVRANGQPPGTIFKPRTNASFKIKLSAWIAGNDPTVRLEVVQNGKIVRTIAGVKHNSTKTLGELTFQTSGWFLVRAMSDNPKTFRFASTAPLYVEYPQSPKRISRSAVRFFQDWVEERAARIKVTEPEKREEVLKYVEAGRKYWAELAGKANVD